MSGRPVPSQLDQVLPRFYVQKAGPYHPFGRIRIAPFGKGDLRILAGVGVYNSQASERRILKRIDVGIAVDLEGGLIVPVLRNVGERDSADLRAGLDRMRVDAMARSIPAEELRGATITLSNFGMFGGR